MELAEQQALVERYLAAYNAFDIDGMLAVLDPQVRFENHAGPAAGTVLELQGQSEFTFGGGKITKIVDRA